MESQSTNPSRNTNSSWIAGVVLIALGAIFMLNQFVPWVSNVIWAAAFGAAGTGVSLVYFRDKRQWWALIPAYVLWMVGAIILLASIRMPGEYLGAFIVAGVGFPFLYVYIKDRRNWWALIPAYVMGTVAGFLMMVRFLPDLMIPAYFNFAVAVPFLYVYLNNRKHWWALIPGGITGLAGVGFMIGAIAPIIPVIMILLGGFILFRQMSSQRQAEAPKSIESVPASRPISGPEADKPVEKFVKIQE